MNKVFTLIVLIISLLTMASTLWAAELKTITLDVDKMTCNMCPITVKKALRKIDGVTNVSAKYEGDGYGWAKITYDSDKVGITDLTLATEDAGYPSRISKSRGVQE